MGANDAIPFGGMKSLGIGLADVQTAAQGASHKLGTRVFDADGRCYVYVEAAGTVTVNAPVKLGADHTVTVSGNAGHIFGVAHVALASGEFGWVRISGTTVVDAATGVLLADRIDAYADANGDAVANAGVTDPVRAVCTVAESGGLATIYLL